jgi:uncharacterized protein YdeI (YjbR/CyaY-like superfamily)
MNTLYVTGREDWRAWLRDNHDSESEVWLVINKKQARQPGVLYDDAVEEALCYGWIDGLARSLDEGSYIQRFTPRRPRSNWSDSNKRRVRKLLTLGLMTEAGLAKIPADVLDGKPDA